MTVKELKKVLDSKPDDMLVAVSSDAEGNEIRRLHSVTVEPAENLELISEGVSEALVLWLAD